ncbi:MAG: MFS transporter [Gammaproteobacteria bacterium]
MSAAAPAGGRMEVLRNRNFARFLAARFAATLALQMQSVAVGWQVYEITGSLLDLGLIGLAQFLPFVALALPAGQLADRLDRRRLLIACYAIDACCALALLAFHLTGLRVAWPIFVVMAVFGAARAFTMPVAQAMTPNLVPPELFPRAVAVNGLAFQIAMITGPAVAGQVYRLGAGVVYSSIALLIGVSVILLASVRYRQDLGDRAPIGWSSLLEGLRFVRSRPIVLGAISLDLFAVLFGGATALLPAYARDVLHVGVDGFGWLRTAPGIGAMLTGLALSYHPLNHHVGRWMFGGVAIYGVATIVFGLSTDYALSLAALMALGAGDMVSVYVRHLLVQLETPDAIRGRVSAVNSMFIGASNELGEFESGIVAAWIGLVPAVVVGGAATLLVVAAWVKLFPVLARMDAFPAPNRAPAAPS